MCIPISSRSRFVLVRSRQVRYYPKTCDLEDVSHSLSAKTGHGWKTAMGAKGTILRPKGYTITYEGQICSHHFLDLPFTWRNSFSHGGSYLSSLGYALLRWERQKSEIPALWYDTVEGRSKAITTVISALPSYLKFCLFRGSWRFCSLRKRRELRKIFRTSSPQCRYQPANNKIKTTFLSPFSTFCSLCSIPREKILRASF